MNISYLCSLHSGLYRDTISTNIDFYELSKNAEDKEYYEDIKKEMMRVISQNDITQKPLI